MNLWFDLKYAWRLLLKSPGHSLLCIGIVSLSVGLSLSVYSIVHNMGFKSLGFEGSDRWYTLNMRNGSNLNLGFHTIDVYLHQELTKRSSEIKHLGALRFAGTVLSERESSVTLMTGVITPALLNETAVAPLLGRQFDLAEGNPGGAAVAILGYEAWQNYFSADPNIVGKSVRINALPTQIVGVMPKDFGFFLKPDVWTPSASEIVSQPAATTVKVTPIIHVDGAQSIASVEKAINAILNDVKSSYPDQYKQDRSIEIVPVRRAMLADAVPIITLDTLVAAAVVLLGCVNIGTLFFARMLERGHELAIRNALGSSRWRLIRQSLAESSIIALLGLVLGIALGAAGINSIRHGMQLLYSAQNQQLPYDFTLGLSESVVALLITALIWLSSTLLPAIHVSKQDAAAVLSGSGKGSAKRSGTKSTNLLVGLQVVISCFLLVVCGTLVAGLNALAIDDYGLTMENRVVSVSGTRFTQSYARDTDRLRYMEELTAVIKAKTAGADAAFTSVLPGVRSVPVAMSFESDEVPTNRNSPLLPLTSVSENYFEVLGITLRSGRLFQATDNSASINVAIIDENLAKRNWPGENPLGKRIQLSPEANGPWLTIVGVVSNVVRNAFDANRDTGSVFRPLRQHVPGIVYLVAKLPGTAAIAKSNLVGAAYAVDRDVPLENIQPLELHVKGLDSLASMAIGLFVNVAFITAFLAATGLYGVISRSVVQRTQEVGVRRALGATRQQIIAVFLRQGAIHLALGIVIGGGLAIPTTNLLGALMPNLITNVLPVSIAVFVGLTVVVLVSSYLPTRRAVALEPGDALRYE